MSIFEILTYLYPNREYNLHVYATPWHAFVENVPMFDSPVYFMSVVQLQTC